ncbi:MAG: hypothetical protein JSW33_08670 [bacterium]|nr:MAG: hypothetical protein JSW33_08670 [bacterium]
MIDQLKMAHFYESILTGLEEKKIPILQEGLDQLLESQKVLPDADFNHARIMVSSWVDFMNALLTHSSGELTLLNLNNHISFIKRVPGRERDYHVRYFRKICDSLFYFLLRDGIILNSSLEIDDEFKFYEFDLHVLKKENKIEELLLSILRKDFNEINETTEYHLRELIKNLKANDDEEMIFHASQLKAIQETILTILQMDRTGQQLSIERKLKKEFELINSCFYLLKKLSEGRRNQSFNGDLSELKVSYDYPFIEILKYLSKWYQTDEVRQINEAIATLNVIKGQKPFRPDDQKFTQNLELLLIISKNFRAYPDATALNVLFQPLTLFKAPPGSPINLLVWDFYNRVQAYREELMQNIEQCLNFFYDLLINQGITLIYKRKIFICIAQICQSWIKKDFVSGELAKKIVTDLIHIKARLKEQTPKKMGKFKEISYQLTPYHQLVELEKGMGTHLLFGLEDFSDWMEGKILRESLANSSIKKEARFQIIENLFKIAIEITEFSKSEDNRSELEAIQKEMIKTFGTKIIEENFPLLPELMQIFYGALIIHAINLAYEVEKLNKEERQQLLNKLERMQTMQYKAITFPLLSYSDSQIFNEEYEKRFSSLISLFHLYIPVTSL